MRDLLETVAIMAFVYAALEGVKYAFSPTYASFAAVALCLGICVWFGIKGDERKRKAPE